MLYLPILIYLYGSLVAVKEFTPGKGVPGVHKAVVRSGVAWSRLWRRRGGVALRRSSLAGGNSALVGEVASSYALMGSRVAF